MTCIPASATTRALVCAVTLAIAGVQQNAQAQNGASSKAAQNAAGVIILNGVNQQNAMRRELHETKEELKAIREGLGIEGPAPPPSPSLPQPNAAFVLLMCVLIFGGIFIVLVSRCPPSGTREQSVYVFCLWVGVPSIFVWMIGWIALVTAMGGPRAMESTVALLMWLFGMVLCPLVWAKIGGVLWDFRNRGASGASVASLPPSAPKTAGPKMAEVHSASRKSQASAKKSGSTHQAAADVYSAFRKASKSTQQSDIALAEPAVSGQATIEVWAMSPDAKRRGPFTPMQMRTAQKNGTVPKGFVFATSPDGPWLGVKELIALLDIL